MSLIATAWNSLYAAQTGFIGTAILATVKGYAANKPAIISTMSLDEVIVAGGTAENGGFTLQMLASDFSAEPPKTTPVTCNGSAQGQTGLMVVDCNLNNGIYYLTIGDFAAE